MEASTPAERTWKLVVLATATALLPLALHAQGADSAPADSTAEAGPTLADLEEKLAILERKLELADEDAAKKKEEGSTATGNRDGFLLKSNDGDFQLRWRGYVHADARYFPDDPDNRWANTFLLRRVRPIWEATAFRYYGFRIMTDFANSSLVVLDAHVDLNFLPEAKFRLGKFKAPIGLERLQSATDIHFIERSYTTGLVPNRDLGAQIHGDLWEEGLGYAVGVFNGVPDGGNRETDSTDHKDYYARVFAHPFKKGNSELLRNLGLGFAASWGRKKGDSASSNLAPARSPAQLTIFQYLVGTTGTPARFVDSNTVHAFGTPVRLNPHGYWYAGSFGLFGEWVASSQEVRKGRRRAVTELTQQAWQVTATWFLTGEQPGFRSPKPRHPLAPKGPGQDGVQGLGAWELVGRVQQFKADPGSFPVFANPRASVSEALTYGGGLAWHLSRSVKWAHNYEYTRFEDGAAATVNGGDRLPEHILSTRLQFTL